MFLLVIHVEQKRKKEKHIVQDREVLPLARTGDPNRVICKRLSKIHSKPTPDKLCKRKKIITKQSPSRARETCTTPRPGWPVYVYASPCRFKGYQYSDLGTWLRCEPVSLWKGFWFRFFWYYKSLEVNRSGPLSRPSRPR